jgi:hypothetical protein
MDRRFAKDGVFNLLGGCVLSDLIIAELQHRHYAACSVVTDVVRSMMQMKGVASIAWPDSIRLAMEMADHARMTLDEKVAEVQAEFERLNREFNHDDMAVEERIAERVGL